MSAHPTQNARLDSTCDPAGTAASIAEGESEAGAATGADVGAGAAANAGAAAKSVKAQLRAHLKTQRASMPPDERASADARIAERVYHLPAWKRAQVVFVYLSFGSEVNTHAIIQRAWSEGKRVALPRCVPNSRLLTWHYVTSFDALEKSTLGVREPAYDTSTLVDPAACNPKCTLALVPGLAFDSCGLRLGYGGGFYDTFLAQFSGISVGLCRKQQFYRSLREQGAVEVHDSPVDAVVTDA